VGTVPQGDSGVGSAANTVALQVGGALGVAVVGSIMSTRYQDHMMASLAGRHPPAGIMQIIIGSFGGALTVAARVGGTTGAELAHAARSAFMGSNAVAMAGGGAVAICGGVVVLAALPSRASDHPADPEPAVPDRPDQGPSPMVQPNPHEWSGSS